MWGPCLDAKGATVTTCGMCRPGEFGVTCDAGTPPPPPPPPPLCSNPLVNTEPGILAGYSPAMGETVKENGQIKVWVTDELPAFIAEKEQIDATTGQVTVPGDRAALNIDGYLNEPTLYVTAMMATAGSGGAGFYPQWVKGDYNNMPSAGPDITKLFGGAATKGPPVDPAPPGTNLSLTYNTEFIWDVNAMRLAPGTYTAEFVIHDGDLDRAVGCITIAIAAAD
jgi:hypothetical protein